MVNNFAICLKERTKGKVRVLCWRRWWVMWQSISIYLVILWKTKLWVIWIGLLLSQCTIPLRKSLNNQLSFVSLNWTTRSQVSILCKAKSSSFIAWKMLRRTWEKRIYDLTKCWSSRRRRGKSMTIKNKSANICMKTICII